MAQKKRERKRIPRANRKNLRLWAEGARETVLRPHFDAYVAALDKGRVEERRFCKSVCREFHARIDWKTPDSEEPIVADWDPLAPTVNEVLPEDEEVRKRARIKELNKRIRRWFVYRIRRLRKHRVSSALDPSKDPYAVLLSQLSGLKNPPKARQAYQQFMHECYQDKVAPIVEERWAMEKEDGNTRTKDHKAGFRAQVARDIFRGLPAAEQDGFASRAKDEAAHAKAAYAKALNEPPSTSPEARQRCISHISDFMGPILKGLHDHTGLHATIILGGPMPQLGGELRTVHVSYGRNKSAAGAHWAQWDRPRFKSDVQNFMIEYLKTAYGSDDCANSALTDVPRPISLLDAAPYTISGTGGQEKKGIDDGSDGSSSDSDSDSDSESDSDSDSQSESEDEEEEGRVKKKARVEKTKGKAKGKGKGKAKENERDKKRTARTKTGAGTINARPSKSSAGPSTAAPAVPSSAAPTVPASTAPAVLAVLTPQEERRRRIANTPLAERAEEDLTYTELRDRNIERNKVEMEKLRREWQGVLGIETPKEKHERKRRTPGALPTRRSARGRAAATMDDEDEAEGSAASHLPTGPPIPPSTVSQTPATSPSATSLPASTAPGEPVPSTASSLAATSAVPGTPRLTTTLGSSSDAPATPETETSRSVSISATPAAMTTSTSPTETPALLAPATSSSTVLASLEPPQVASSRSSLVPCPPKAAPWFVDAHAVLTKVDLGHHFNAVIAAWTRLEVASRFENGPTNLSAMHRPKQVAAWIATKRSKSLNAGTLVDDPAAYAVQWQQWWDSLQPTWRRRCADGSWSVVDGYGENGREWGPLYRWGVNGMLSVVASLYFWGCGVKDESARGSWESAVGDVVWMMEGMAAYYELFKGRF